MTQLLASFVGLELSKNGFAMIALGMIIFNYKPNDLAGPKQALHAVDFFSSTDPSCTHFIHDFQSKKKKECSLDLSLMDGCNRLHRQGSAITVSQRRVSWNRFEQTAVGITQKTNETQCISILNAVTAATLLFGPLRPRG